MRQCPKPDFILTPVDDSWKGRKNVTTIAENGRVASVRGGDPQTHAAGVIVAQMVLKHLKNTPVGPGDKVRIIRLVKQYGAALPKGSGKVKIFTGARRKSS